MVQKCFSEAIVAGNPAQGVSCKCIQSLAQSVNISQVEKVYSVLSKSDGGGIFGDVWLVRRGLTLIAHR